MAVLTNPGPIWFPNVGTFLQDNTPAWVDLPKVTLRVQNNRDKSEFSAVLSRMIMTLGIEGISDVVRHTTGGSSTIYRARQDRFGREVAIKVLNGPPSPELTERFERELRVAGRVSGHPGILEIFDSGTTSDGLPWIMMPFIDGESLQRELDVNGASNVDAAVSDVIKIAEAVEYAHRNGVVHCDLKPGNVLRGRIGQPILIDFGVAQVDNPAHNPPVSTGSTPAYTAPERFRNAAPVAATDIYSLGALLYTLLNGRPAFLDGKNVSVASVVRRVTNENPVRIPGVSPAVMEVVLHSMAKNPQNRPQSASLFAHYLSVALKDQSTPTHRPAVASSAAAGATSVDSRSVYSSPAPDVPRRVTEARSAIRSTTATPRERRAEAALANTRPLTDAEADIASGGPSEPPQPSNQSSRLEPADQTRRGLWWTGAAAAALLLVVGASFLLWRFALDVSDPTLTAKADVSELETAADETTVEASPELPAAETSTDTNPVQADANGSSAGDTGSAANPLGDTDGEALGDLAVEELEAPSAVEFNYEGLRFRTSLNDGWVPVSEDRDVGYGYRTRFEGQNTDFLYVDFTPPERQSGSETIEQSAERIAAQIRSASEVQYEQIGAKDTWWFSYIGNDGSERIDVFFVENGTGYAVVGGSHTDPALAWEAVYNFVLNLEST